MRRTLSCFITDDRRTIQTLVLWVDQDPATARERARLDLLAQPNHLAIDVWDGERRLFRLCREDLDTPSAAPLSAAAAEGAGSAGTGSGLGAASQ